MSISSEFKKFTGKVVKEVSRFADDLTGINLLGKSMPISTAGTLLQGVVQGASQTAASTKANQVLPGVTEPVELSIATTSYLETQEYLALQRQKALVKGIAGSGIISEKQAGEMAMPPTKKPIDLKVIAVIMIVFWGLTRWK